MLKYVDNGPHPTRRTAGYRARPRALLTTSDIGREMEAGPMAFMTVMPNGAPKMGGQLLQWFVYSAIVGVFAAYIAGHALGPGAHYLAVFRFVGATAFMCYTVAGWQASIWYRREWSTTLKNTFDGLVYACLTAGVFGWLWPA